MEVNKISIKNMKSFGNDSQTINFDSGGNLILMSGRNGSGKSTIIDSFDYVLFNKVKGRKSKKVKLTSLPNRINKALEIDIEFKAKDGTLVEIKRGTSPSILTLKENGIENLRAGKDKINTLIENYVGIDHETFKGFISMSINDFKNFISLTNEEKKLLLDKLFNLEVIGVLNTILNGLIKDNRDKLVLMDKEIDILSDNINNINISIDKVKKSKEDDLEQQLVLIKESIESHKEPFNKVKERLTQIKDRKAEISEKIDSERTLLIESRTEISQIDKQLKLFENDKCPTCQADLNSGFHKGIKESFIEKKEKFTEVMNKVKERGLELSERLKKLNTLSEKGDSKYQELYSNLKSLKRDYDKLSEKKKDSSNQDLDEFVNTVKNLGSKLKEVETNKSDEEDRKIYHKNIKSILSEDGIKKTIIENIIEPINYHVSESIRIMHLPFEVELDNNFNATVTTMGEEVDTETLSTGETKALNIAIMIGYLKLIRTKKQINVLFLDEVFSSIDIERINDVLLLLRDLAETSDINIFLVHHSILDQEHFDKILKIEKEVFTMITEVK